MSVAWELKKSEEEIMHWPLQTLKRWWTYFIVKNEMEAEAIKKAREDAERKAGRR